MGRNIKQLLKIIPESIQVECLGIAESTRQKSWRIGDITNQIKREVLENPRLYADVEIMTIYQAVSVMLNHEYSARTVREFSHIAETFPPALRDQYEILPYSHFRFAATCRDPLAVLDLSQARCIKNGCPPTVEWLSVMVNGVVPEMPSDIPLSQATPIFVPEYSDVDISGRSKEVKDDNLIYAVQTFEAVIEQVDLPPIVLSAVRSLWEQIKSLVFQERVRE